MISLLRVAALLVLLIAQLMGDEKSMHEATAVALSFLLIDWRPNERD